MYAYLFPYLTRAEAEQHLHWDRVHSASTEWQLRETPDGLMCHFQGESDNLSGYDFDRANIPARPEDGTALLPIFLPPLDATRDWRTLAKEVCPAFTEVDLISGKSASIALATLAPQALTISPTGEGTIGDWATDFGRNAWELYERQITENERKLEDMTADVNLLPDLIRLIYEAFACCYDLTFEAFSYFQVASTGDIEQCLGRIWGADPKLEAAENDTSPSSPAASSPTPNSPP